MYRFALVTEWFYYGDLSDLLYATRGIHNSSHNFQLRYLKHRNIHFSYWSTYHRSLRDDKHTCLVFHTLFSPPFVVYRITIEFFCRISHPGFVDFLPIFPTSRLMIGTADRYCWLQADIDNLTLQNYLHFPLLLPFLKIPDHTLEICHYQIITRPLTNYGDVMSSVSVRIYRKVPRTQLLPVRRQTFFGDYSVWVFAHEVQFPRKRAIVKIRF